MNRGHYNFEVMKLDIILKLKVWVGDQVMLQQGLLATTDVNVYEAVD